MEDLSMHLHELVFNSIEASATNIKIQLFVLQSENKIQMNVIDNGDGMDEETVKQVCDPFQTSRKTRHIGMGLAFLKQLTEMCDGSLTIESKKGLGTSIQSSIQLNHIDTPPLGDMGLLMMECIQANDQIDYTFEYHTDQKTWIFKSKEIAEELGGISLQEPTVLLWIKDYINQNLI